MKPDSTPAPNADAPAVVEDLVRQAEAAGASDIHLQMRAGQAEVAFRLNGLLAPIKTLPADLAERVLGRFKFLARLKTYQESLPQDGRINAADVQARHDLRIATYPTVTGEKLVVRLFQTSVVQGLPDLELAAPARAALELFLRQPAGLLLLTGPAGSGKTTTIYACLRHLAEAGGRHIITVEDPVEQILPGVMQTEVNDALGLDFAKAARHLLRQDPQVLVLGEIRDDATASLAVRAALTGHLVISTLHAGSCRGVCERLLAMCPDHSAVASAVDLILNQRLVRRVCRACAGAGCDTCLQTGYRGRVPLVEWVAANDALRHHLRAGDATGVAPQNPLLAAARELVSQGVTNNAELSRLFGL